MNKTYDFIGIGLGPFNLSLAALSQPIKECNAVFFEKNAAFNWHPGMLLNEAKLQVPFIADMVTLSDPTNRFSFLSYLHHHKRLYKFYFLENFHISRQEYNHYCQWIVSQLSNVYFNHNVTSVERCGEILRVSVKEDSADQVNVFYTKHVVLGVGSVPHIPEKITKLSSDYIQHSANFLDFNQKKLKSVHSVCVIGSGQSAAEIILELLNQYDVSPKKIVWTTRSPGFFPMEYSKLGLEHFSPEYMNYFYSLHHKLREELIPKQDFLYKGISQKTIADIFDKLYQITIAGHPQPLTMLAHSELDFIEPLENHTNERFRLYFIQLQMKQVYQINSDAIILATGFRPLHPKFLDPMADCLLTDFNQSYALNNDFSIKTPDEMSNKIFVQNNSIYSHGVGSPDLGLGCYRNSIIINTILKKEYYPVHSNNVFQTFGIPDSKMED